MPFERAQIEHRAGVALAAAGERELALERLCDAYRTARKLGARPLASEVAREVAALGESVVGRLGARAAADADGGGLSRREREVVRLLAVGRTNREIAQDLFLSPRTVDMHVRNILRKLDCRSRVEAAGRARELGLTASLDPPLRRGALAARVAGVGRSLGLDQEHLRVVGLRAVLDAARHDVELARAELDVAVAQLDREAAGEHEEEVVGVVVLVPDELAVGLARRRACSR